MNVTTICERCGEPTGEVNEPLCATCAIPEEEWEEARTWGAGGLLWGPKYRNRMYKRVDLGDSACILCGRPTNDKHLGYGVVVCDGGSRLVHPDDAHMVESDPGFMGWFPVGSTCVKKVPAAFRVAPKDCPWFGEEA